ncbi:MAG: FAD-binding oxidoreductase [Rhodobacteraceae bacterium]|nr:FAD-binding oxidoreductase [Paracoccaceae bacterium]
MPLNPADAAFADSLAAALGPGVVAPAEPRYLEEPRRRVTGIGAFVARPRTTQEVAAIVAACAQRHVGIVPWGGGTGLVLGQVLPAGPPPLILSLERMAAIRGLWPEEAVMIAEAGCILADVHRAAGAAGRAFPLTLASQGSARIGGLLSTNAGGVNVLRYGNARDLVLGIEAVLPDGAVMHGLTRLRKDNTGYDLRHLLIGAEGTLGVITAAALRLHPVPADTAAALVVVPGPAAALDLLALAQERTGGRVEACELIGEAGWAFLAETMPLYRLPLPAAPAWSVLVEVAGSTGATGGAALEAVLAEGAERGLLSDGILAASQARRDALWQFREAIPEANRRIGAVSSHDIALPLSRIAEFIDRAPAEVARIGAFRINVFGHLGDGNLHWNVFPPKGVAAADVRVHAPAVQRAVHDLVHAMGGTISAEHGIGRLKVEDLERYGDPARLAAMRAVKRALDPAGIMNPGAVLRA